MGIKCPQPFDNLFDSLRWAPFSLNLHYVLAKLLQNGAKFIQNWQNFKNYMRNLDNFRQAVESPKSWNSVGYICIKTTFLHLKTLFTDLSNITFNWLVVWNWRGIDLSFQTWHEEFDKFWPKHLKVSKILTLINSFWANHIFFELKKYTEVIFHETEDVYKIWRETGLLFQNWHKEFNKFWPEHSKVS